MNRAPRYSVIVPAFNTAAYVGEAIESVRRQTVADWELVVVDDGSTDDTASVVERVDDPRIRLIRQANAGVSAARNRGAAGCRGEFFHFLDADDRLRPDALERLGALLAAHPDAGMVYGECVTIDAEGRICGAYGQPIFGPRPSGRILPHLLPGTFISTGMALLRAVTFRRAGGFDQELRLSEDWELWCRVASQSEILYLGGEPILEYRLHPASTSRTKGIDAGGYEERRKTIDRAFGNPLVTAGFTQKVLARMRRQREAGALAFMGTAALHRRDWSSARRCFWSCLRQDPARPREIILLASALLRWLPPAVERRLK
jgi:glycosyltransferase involved in cell wall biosynthesis